MHRPDFVLDGANVSYRLPAYNPLADQYLNNYFSNEFNRKHLKKIGIIDNQGNILPE